MMRSSLLTAAALLAAGPALAQAQDAIGQLSAQFARIDTDGDGAISRGEFRALQAARWTQIDRNGDGYLTEDDFPRIAAARASAQLAAMASVDADGDGRISRDELLDGPAPLFQQADQDGDGLVTRAELAAAAS
jgi:Ca2+-binding protein (EF-Hand superfamily)